MPRPQTKALIVTGYDDLLESLKLSVAGLEEAGMVQTYIVSFEVGEDIKELVRIHAEGGDPWKR